MDFFKRKASIGNSFNKATIEFNHARKMWREQREVLPSGGTITNVADFVDKGVIPSGSAVVFDDKAKTMKVLKDSDITGAGNVDTLNINGFLKEDVPVEDAQTVGTGTVVVDGDLYAYMFEDAVLAKLKGMTKKNGMKIRFVQ